MSSLLPFLTLLFAIPALADPSLSEEVVHSEVSSLATRVSDAGPLVFCILMVLVGLSAMTWAVALTKWRYLRQVEGRGEAFIKSFWDSRSLNELHQRLSQYDYSPVREVFRSGYGELLRGASLKEQASTSDMALKAAIDNLSRSLQKAKLHEKRSLESYLPILAISASSAPFIGLFGTVWGIMGAFEGIARTGASSLAAVAPGISEALIATAFGLAAAIPAAIGYNLANHRIRGILGQVDGFGADFLNIVERYLVSDRLRTPQQSHNMPNI